MTPGTGSWIWFRFDVAAAAPKPHRDGENQDKGSTTLPFSGKNSPLSTSSARTARTSIGMAWSDELTNAEISRPTAIDATASTAMASTSSTSGRDVREDA